MSDQWLMDRIAVSPPARRELAWLRAKEQGDDELADHLEQTDPGITVRLRGAGFDVDDAPAEEAAMHERERFARFWDARYEHHANLFSEARDVWVIG